MILKNGKQMGQPTSKSWLKNGKKMTKIFENWHTKKAKDMIKFQSRAKKSPNNSKKPKKIVKNVRKKNSER